MTTDCSEWRQAFAQLSETVFGVVFELDLVGGTAQQALRALRSFVRGFVLNEMAGSFLDPLEYQRSYQLGMETLILGLPASEAHK